MKYSLLAASSLEWLQTISTIPHDFYHLPGYVALCTERDKGKPIAFVANEGDSVLFIPMILRQIQLPCSSSDQFDITSPYGYPGPIFSSGSKEDKTPFLHRALRALIDVLEQRQVVSLFLRFHPILSRSVTEDFSQIGELRCNGETVYIDLKLSDEDLWRQTRRAHRYDISKAIREGQSVCFDNSWEYINEFCNLYRETMKRRHASEFYFFNDEYFVRLKDALQDKCHLCLVRIDDEIAAGGIFVETDGIVQYHLSGSSVRFSKQQPTKLMLHYVTKWAKERGNRYFHLGGGVGGSGDSLFHFKAGFSKLTYPFYTLRAIVDNDAYSELVKQSQKRGVSNGDGDFFPAYRQRS